KCGSLLTPTREPSVEHACSSTISQALLRPLRRTDVEQSRMVKKSLPTGSTKVSARFAKSLRRSEQSVRAMDLRDLIAAEQGVRTRFADAQSSRPAFGIARMP